ncbi:hypothetical protein [Chelatococcus asaccharovorans]|uniref:Uncharacterized protein n=1 Tax=Chelatococcus asaccharovorans TaxID=28210 RepID=A0A2V3UDL5_9HYPH|nr:hypothetical protein [Chelatococcus asaccharovorans]MBS7703264.1 hypothetical protein [Chelatococcus asaccharovorans]PXW61596.1 hypothetical protein C7450_103113 [Chelatococcus asaccharovorans]
MLAMIHLDWKASTTIRELPRDKWEDLRQGVRQLNLPEWKEADEKAPYFHLSEEILVDLATHGGCLTRNGVRFEITHFEHAYRTRGTDERGDEHHLHVHVPDQSLLSISEVEQIPNADLWDVQRRLDDGWHILAVCPPNGTMKPDFIMGRSRRAEA